MNVNRSYNWKDRENTLRNRTITLKVSHNEIRLLDSLVEAQNDGVPQWNKYSRMDVINVALEEYQRKLKKEKPAAEPPPK